ARCPPARPPTSAASATCTSARSPAARPVPRASLPHDRDDSPRPRDRDRDLGLLVSRLGGSVLPARNPLRGLPRLLRPALRRGGGELDLLPHPAAAHDRADGAEDPAGIPLRGQAPPVHDPRACARTRALPGI